MARLGKAVKKNASKLTPSSVILPCRKVLQDLIPVFSLSFFLNLLTWADIFSILCFKTRFHSLPFCHLRRKGLLSSQRSCEVVQAEGQVVHFKLSRDRKSDSLQSKLRPVPKASHCPCLISHHLSWDTQSPENVLDDNSRNTQSSRATGVVQKKEPFWDLLSPDVNLLK